MMELTYTCTIIILIHLQLQIENLHTLITIRGLNILYCQLYAIGLITSLQLV